MKLQLIPENYPMVFGSNSGCPIRIVDDLHNLDHVGLTKCNPMLMIGDTWTFPSVDEMMKHNCILLQVIHPGSSRVKTLVLGERTRHGISELAWFDLSYLIKSDYLFNPVFHRWYYLRTDRQRIYQLADKTFEIDNNITYKAPVFDHRGKPTGGYQVKQILEFPFEGISTKRNTQIF